jgi:hypothetical protein
MLKTLNFIRYLVKGISTVYYLRRALRSDFSAVRAFFQSGNTGSNVYKISIRMRDLQRIISLFLPSKFAVLEFGSGSSTLFFYSHKKVTSLISLERERDYLPRLTSEKRKKFFAPILQTKEVYKDSFKSNVFTNIESFVQKADLIYIDGPRQSQANFFGTSEPNLDLLDYDLASKVVLVDCRILTTLNLSLNLNVSHLLIPCMACRRSYERSTELQNNFPHFNVLIYTGFELARKHEFYPVRTCVFIPKSRY